MLFESGRNCERNLLTWWVTGCGMKAEAGIGAAKPLLIQALFARERCCLALEPHFPCRNSQHKDISEQPFVTVGWKVLGRSRPVKEMPLRSD